MKALLVRVGIDHSFGGWNAPANPITRRFLYVPIPEKSGTPFHPGCKRTFEQLVPTIQQFAADHALDAALDVRWPTSLESQPMHLDPDFDCLTYGDNGDRRGSDIQKMQHGDIIVFYAGLRSVCPEDTRLIYALVGLFVVDEVVKVANIPKADWDSNAHTRKLKHADSDIVVRAVPHQSGRFARFLPIGEYRDRAYRVRPHLLKEWGGLSVRDGYLQRSARPPSFLQPQRFLAWLDRQDVELIQMNNERLGDPRVVLVLLRRPNTSNPYEMRSDPFWEFGSFGCTGCHSSNLMNLNRIDELEGVRFGFAQGGPLGIRLVKLTPPVTVVKHREIAEVRWAPTHMPLRYDAAPLIIDNEGDSDFGSLYRMIADVNRPTWMARFASKFRSRRQLLPPDTAKEVVSVFSQHLRQADVNAVARSYAEALPYLPPHVDVNRDRTYRRMLRMIGKPKESGCKRKANGRRKPCRK